MGESRLLRPTTMAEALARLAAHEDARCLAGGATLVALMNAGLVAPAVLVSLAAVEGLGGIAELPDETLRIGAMTRHRETADETRLRHGNAVLRQAAAQIANPVVRNMGTIGGSVAFADPAADYPPALVAADATIEIAGEAGRRQVPADAFFADWYRTALAPGEIVTAVHVPPASASSDGAFHKLARVSGDFAIASVAVFLATDEDTKIETLRVVVGGCGPKPVRAADLEQQFVGSPLHAVDARQLGAALAKASDPVDDVRASADYRRTVIPRMTEHALARASSGMRRAA
jgi:carbon-monoxide dehydrogenase medium subunit